jgi:hypothetical protein
MIHARNQTGDRESNSMYAVIRESHYKPDQADPCSAPFGDYQALNSQQSGYLGSLVVDAGGGRFLSVALWERLEDADTARVALAAATQRGALTLVGADAKLVARGSVVVRDLRADSALAGGRSSKPATRATRRKRRPSR